MVKRFLKRILVFSSVACLVLACVPSVSFAIDPVSGAAALAGAIDAYGMAYGVGTVYDVSSSSGVTSSFEGLWDEFSEYQSNAGSQFDYDSFIDDYNQNRSLYGFEHSSGKFAAWSIDAESAEIFDQFWNWLLTGPAEMTRVDNEYFQFSQSQIGDEAVDIPVFIFNSVFPGQPLPVYSSTMTKAQAFDASLKISPVLPGTGWQYGLMSSVPNCYAFKYGNYTVVASLSSSFVRVDTRKESASYYVVTQSSGSPTFAAIYNNTNVYMHQTQHGGGAGSFSYLPTYNSLGDGLSAAFASMTGETPTDSIGVKANDDTGVVTLPNPYGQDYVPVPLEIVTNIPWDSTYDDTDEEDGAPVPFPPVDVPLVIDDIISAISAEDYALEEDPQDPDPDVPPPVPSEVFVPLLPVGLPSFNFSFSGIWHYVREWVASLGAWFTTLFTIWGALPYAMVVPVYATAVVVIVLGVYKRFFM